MRIYVGQINPVVADLGGNGEKIVQGIRAAVAGGANVAVFPELALTGYPPDDFLLLPHFLDAVGRALQYIVEESYGITVIVGVPRANRSGIGKPLYNSAAIIQEGQILGYQDKILLPTYDVFDERRYFEPGVWTGLWDIGDEKVAITICEDIWRHSGFLSLDRYVRDPVQELMMAVPRPRLLINLSASPYNVDKGSVRKRVASDVAHALGIPLLLCNQVGGNDSLIFDGGSFYMHANGTVAQSGLRFVEDSFFVETSSPAAGEMEKTMEPMEELCTALVLGLRDYFQKSCFSKACLGLSGGIDSALVAYLAVEALGNGNVIGVSMPSRYSSPGSIADAVLLADNLGIELITLPIEAPFEAYLEMLAPTFNGLAEDVTEENLQSRIRGMILMALSNKLGYIVLNTGNKTELAMGYCTLYGDMCGGISVINDLTKRRVYALARWINRERVIIPQSSIDKAPSAELRPNQKDSDSLPDYETLDTIVEQYLEQHMAPQGIAAKFQISPEVVEAIVVKIHKAEYKRRQSPPGLRVTEKAFSVGRRFPIVQGWT